jgi:3-phenylpropionate/cinnamic acid dioxygenase small subunit
MPGVTPELQLEIQNFLYHEAILLEETRFRDWLALLTDDVR